jgi:hypothetical protein
VFTGHDEPWDAEGRYYVWALLVAGAVATISRPKAFLLAPVGVCIGQLLYCRTFFEAEADGLWLLGMMLIVVYSVVALVGAVGCAILMWLLRLPFGLVRFGLRRRKRPKHESGSVALTPTVPSKPAFVGSKRRLGK